MEKWVSSKAKKGRSKVRYHTTESCWRLQKVDNYRPATEDELEWHEAVECSTCERERTEA